MKISILKHINTLVLISFVLLLNSSNILAHNDTLIFLGDRDFYPYEFIDDNGEATGFNIDMINAISKVINIETDVRLLTWEDALKTINKKRNNVVICLIYSKNRSEKFYLSKPFNIISYSIFTRKDLIINSLDDIKGKRIIVQKGDVAENYLVENNYSPNIIEVKNHESALKLLSSGKHDCAFLSYLNATHNIKKLKLKNIRSSVSAFPSKEYCFATNKTDTLLIAKINNAIDILKNNGEYFNIYNKWFTELEKKNINKSSIRDFIIIGMLLFISIIIIIFLVWLLRKKVKQKTQEINKELNQRRKIQEQLLSSEKRIRQIVDLVPLIIFAKDEKNNIILANKAASDFMGISSDKILTKENIKEKYIGILEKIKYSDKKQVINKYSIENANGDERIFNITMIPYTEYSSKEKSTLVVAVDITRQNQIENSLTKEKSILHSLINSIPDLIFYKDIDGKYIGANKAFLDFYNFKEIDFLGKTDYELYDSDRADYQFQSDSEILIDKKTYRGETWDVNKNGDKIIFDTVKKLFIDDTGNILGIIGICRDITERYETTKLLKKAKGKAEKTDKFKTAFLANMSHEIRTPLNSIIGFSDLLVDPDLTTDQKEEYVDLINQSGISLLNLIDEILDISKIEAGQIQINQSECRLNKIMNELYYSFDGIKNNRHKDNVTLSYETENKNDNFTIVTDGFRLKQILTNLIGNALKFTEEGYIKFGYSITEDNFLQFYVNDSGIGISEKEKNLVFDRFKQLKTNRNKEGSGLGLAISKKLVELLGGEIWVSSVKDKGTTFYFKIPLVEISATKPADKKTKSIEGLNWENKKILVAEDNEVNYILIHEMLRKTNAKIIWAKNGQEAVDICKKDDVNAVLMDIKMPVLDGIEATTQIKSFNKNIPIIAQTAYALDEDKDRLLNYGCDAYLAKPIILNKLISTLNEFL